MCQVKSACNAQSPEHILRLCPELTGMAMKFPPLLLARIGVGAGYAAGASAQGTDRGLK